MKATLVFLSLLILCCVTFVSCRGKPPPATNQTAWKNFINQTCNRFETSYASQWQLDMLNAVPKGAKVDEKTVTFLAVNVGVQNANALLDFMNNVTNTNNLQATPNDIQSGQKCAGELQKAFTPLNKVAGHNPASLPDLDGFLDDIFASARDCVDLVKNFDTDPSIAADKAGYASDSLNMARGLFSSYSFGLSMSGSTPPQPTTTPPQPPTQPPAGGGDWTEFIREACNNITKDYVQQCQDDMLQAQQKGGGGGDMIGTTLAFLAMNVSVERADSFVDFMNDIISDKDTATSSQGDKQLARKCVGELHKSLAPLDKAPVRDPRYLDGITSFFKGLAASETDCQKMATRFGSDEATKVDQASRALASTNFAITMIGDYLAH